MNIMPDLNPIGLCGLQGTYTRRSPNGFREVTLNWWIDVNSIGECHLYTNDALTDCYTSDNAYCSDSMDDCLNKVREIIREAAA